MAPSATPPTMTEGATVSTLMSLTVAVALVARVVDGGARDAVRTLGRHGGVRLAVGDAAESVLAVEPHGDRRVVPAVRVGAREWFCR